MKTLRNLALVLSLVSLGGCVMAMQEAAGSKSRYGAETIGPIGVPLASRDAPAPVNAMGVTGTINVRDAQSLFDSLDAMVGGLDQANQLAFMEAFFRVAYFDDCDITGRFLGKGNIAYGGRRSLGSCLSRARIHREVSLSAEAYVADKRMDPSRAYVASNGFGSWTGGRTQRESYVAFISKFGAYLDGRSADYILQRNKDIMRKTAVSFRNR